MSNDETQPDERTAALQTASVCASETRQVTLDGECDAQLDDYTDADADTDAEGDD